MFRVMLVAAYLIAASHGLGAQQVAVTRLTAPDAELREPFMRIDGV